jgi:C4-type Zn-finger protein
MTCPICKKSGARRSHRQTVTDHVISIFGVYPWRCHECHARFHSRLMPLSFMFRAHCPHCGNLEVRRISPDFVNTPLGGIWRLLQIPALRCDPCRHKYFSVLPLRDADESYYNTSSAD